jgi:predicted TIM-barrel fold metal-dependent hydrolase
VVLTTQPTEEPDKPEYLAQILDMMDAARTVMFSSDYPHWDNDNPSVLFRRLDRRLRGRILAGTAAEVYGLHEKPPRVTPPAAAREQPAAGTIPPRHLGQVE